MIFPKLFKFARAILSLPHSNATTECTSSNLNLIKLNSEIDYIYNHVELFCIPKKS